ncbi:MAG TPA: ATP-binding protein, partial [Verrucomicrobiae bacterium]
SQLMEKGKWAGELNAKTKDGRKIIISTRWTLIRDEKDQTPKILSISHDITRQKHTEAQLLRIQRQQTIGTLASGVAHDLNNILAPLLVGFPIIREENLSRESRELLGLMEDNIQRGADIVRQLLIFGRGGDTQRLPINPKRQILEVTKIIRETFPKNIRLEIMGNDDLESILADPTQVYQVFLNLCVNARDAMPQGGQLTIAARNVTFLPTQCDIHPKCHPGNYVVISCKDTGTGMPAEVLERIFEPFYTTKELGQGTGLGLSVVIGVVESHGGFVNVQSKVGEGSEFAVYFPAIMARPPEKPASPPSAT